MPLAGQDSTSNASAPGFPDAKVAEAMCDYIKTIKAEGDSAGCIVEFRAYGVPAGWGEPLYAKLDAQLAQSMMSIPATKGFALGQGFAVANLLGSQHNDTYSVSGEAVQFDSNHAGGILGGISSGEVIYGQVAFKPTSSIAKAQATVDHTGQAKPSAMAQGVMIHA